MASRTSKIACSIDRELLSSAERLRARTGETRSALIARALAGLMREHERAERSKAYVQAYLKQPERDVDVEAARRAARKAFALVEWDDT